MLEAQSNAAAKIVSDVLWCEKRETHSLYGATWLMQPFVEEPAFASLRELSRLHAGEAT